MPPDRRSRRGDCSSNHPIVNCSICRADLRASSRLVLRDWAADSETGPLRSLSVPGPKAPCFPLFGSLFRRAGRSFGKPLKLLVFPAALSGKNGLFLRLSLFFSLLAGSAAVTDRLPKTASSATHSQKLETSPSSVQWPAFRGPLRRRRLETARIGSSGAQLAVRSLTSNFQSPEFARGLGRNRFAFSADRFALLRGRRTSPG